MRCVPDQRTRACCDERWAGSPESGDPAPDACGAALSQRSVLLTVGVRGGDGDTEWETGRAYPAFADQPRQRGRRTRRRGCKYEATIRQSCSRIDGPTGTERHRSSRWASRGTTPAFLDGEQAELPEKGYTALIKTWLSYLRQLEHPLYRLRCHISSFPCTKPLWKHEAIGRTCSRHAACRSPSIV